MDHGEEMRDFVDTAAIIANLDLVISIDSAAAHLAGAMGTSVWLMLPYSADWRWMNDREDCPWYPTMKLFRQSSTGDWPGVTQRVATALKTL
jgi:ADP-heptose:LPS heptosyltransferase